MAHYLESWSDARAYDGTISIIQPMIDPLYDGRTVHDVLQVPLDPSISAYDAVNATAKPYIQGHFATGWRQSLHDGWVAGTGSMSRGGAENAGEPAADGWTRRSTQRHCPRAQVAQATASRATRLPARIPLLCLSPRSRQPRLPAAGSRVSVPARPVALRRPLRQQRLAAGAAQAGDQPQLGQRGCWSRLTRWSSRSSTENDAIELHVERPQDHGAGADGAWPPERLR